MKLGIIGLPQSGKTTVFNALTRGNLPTTISGGQFSVHTAVVDVPDERVDALAQMYNPKKVTYAKVTYADIAGLEGGKSGDISGALLNSLSQMDGFIHVVRCFPSDMVPHPFGSIDPQRDINTMESEFLLNDLIAVERKLARLEEELKKGGGRDKKVIADEQQLFEKLHAALSDDIPLRQIPLTAEEEKILSGYGFLSQKPLLLVLNLGDGQAPPPISTPGDGVPAIPLQGKLEMEMAQLPPEEAELFMVEFGIEELGLHKMIRLSYEVMGLQSFFTVGEDEVRAWTIRKGATALDAAGTIHTDLMKGFIRAEVISFDELIALGGMGEARKKGRLRLEGKEYLVQDGDVVHIRFNV